VTLPGLKARWDGVVGPSEIKTLLLRRGKRAWEWLEADLLERPLP
jgi:hypothetical protein